MEANETRTVTMTDAEMAQFRAFQKEQADKEAKAAQKKMREDYREMVDDMIESIMPGLKKVSDDLTTYKRKVFEEFSTILQIKAEIFKTDKGKEMDNLTHNFTNSDGTMRIVLGHYVTDGYLDTADEGIAKVHQYINSLVSDAKSRELVDMVMRLLAKDKKGTLKASRIVQLRQLADKSGSPEFLEGVKIIEESYRPQTSRTFLRAFIKDEKTGAWVQLPLGMTEASETE